MHYFLLFLTVAALQARIFVKKTTADYVTRGVPKAQLIAEQKLSPKQVGDLYQMAQLLDNLFRENGIRYWIDGGSLLGAVRHGGLMPWDNDIDLKIFISDATRVEKVKHLLAKHGIAMKAFHQKSDVAQRFTLWGKENHADIFFTRVVSPEGRVDLSTPEHQSVFQKSYYYLHEVLPTRRLRFGPAEVEGPNAPIRYLRTFYGEHWNDVTYIREPTSAFRRRYRKGIYFSLVDKIPCYYKIVNPFVALPHAKDDPYCLNKESL